MQRGKGSTVSCVLLSVNFNPEDRGVFYNTLRSAFEQARGEEEGKFATRHVDSNGAIMTAEEWNALYKHHTGEISRSRH
jgi:hypothetical protein